MGVVTGFTSSGDWAASAETYVPHSLEETQRARAVAMPISCAPQYVSHWLYPRHMASQKIGLHRLYPIFGVPRQRTARIYPHKSYRRRSPAGTPKLQDALDFSGGRGPGEPECASPNHLSGLGTLLSLSNALRLYGLKTKPNIQARQEIMGENQVLAPNEIYWRLCVLRPTINPA